MEKLETTLKKHTNYIYEYENALDDTTLDRIKNNLEEEFSINEIDPDVFRLKSSRNNDAYTLGKYKNNKVISDINDELEKIGYGYLVRYYEDCPLIKSYYQPYGIIGSAMTYRFYNKNDFYNWHVDSDGRFNLLVSFLLYLNDDFDGGSTKFLNDKLKVAPKKGSVLMFPCGPYFLHKSTPITSGTKHVIWNCYVDYPKEFVEAVQQQ